MESNARIRLIKQIRVLKMQKSGLQKAARVTGRLYRFNKEGLGGMATPALTRLGRLA